MAYEICIRVDDEGKISVGTKPEGEEDGVVMGSGGEQGAAMGSDEGGEAGYKAVGSIKEAMMTAMEIYANEGQMGAGESDFDAGYGGGQKTEAPIREMSDEDEERM